MIYITILSFITFVVSVLIGIYSIPRIVSLAHEMHLYDLPDSRKVHKLPIPRLGGVAFLPIVLIATVLVAVAAVRIGLPVSDFMGDDVAIHFLAYIAGGFMLFLTGIYDDVHGVSYRFKFIVQIFASFLLCVSGLWIADMGHVFFVDEIPFWIGMPLTMLFVVYVTNAMNLIDGIDGLASGISCIAFFVLALLFVVTGEYLWTMLCAAYIGILLTFFYFNVFGKKNKVFMGDAGSLILGYTLSFMIIHFWRANPVWNSVLHNIGIIAISTLIIPSMDVVRVFSSRIRDGRNPFLPDKNHIHHKLLRTGMGAKMTMITILCLSALFIFANYIVAAYCNQTLIVLLDIALFFIMHGIINIFIARKEKSNGISYDRKF